MPDNDKMQRVSRKYPCPVCDKPDWCLVAKDGSAAICARIEDGSVKRCGDAGNLHILRHNVHNVHNVHRGSANKWRIVKSICTDNVLTKDFEHFVGQCRRQLSRQKLHFLAVSLGVSVKSLKRLKVGWDGEAFTFGMSNAENRIIGVRRRFPDGYKCSVSGSTMGLFIPDDLVAKQSLFIVEGESDLAAALDLGLNAIGRPNCNSKIEMTARFVMDRQEAVIVADNDQPGRDGAKKLADKLALYCPSVKIIYPPEGIKDLRQWLKAGLTRGELQKIIENTKHLTMELR